MKLKKKSGRSKNDLLPKFEDAEDMFEFQLDHSFKERN